MKWREALQLAPTVDAVTGVMRDYARELGPVIAVLPEECQAALGDDLDVQSAAVALLHSELRFEGSDEARGLLHEMACTFASAAVRVTLLHSGPAMGRARAESGAAS